MKRKFYDRMLKWKEQSNGRSALMIEGARRVGKSYLAEEIVVLFTEKHSSGYEHSRGFITIDVDTSRIKDLYEKGMVIKPLMNLMNVRVEKI